MRFEVGQRIVIRYRLADGLHDALGEALEVAPTHVTVATRRGPVRVEAATDGDGQGRASPADPVAGGGGRPRGISGWRGARERRS